MANEIRTMMVANAQQQHPSCGSMVLSSTGASSGGKRLLIVEDDLNDLALYRRMFATDEKLRSLFQEIIHTDNFFQARRHIEEKVPDCCLMDFRLPEGLATDFIQTLNRDGLRFPIVISTGVGNERLVVELMQLGVQDYLTKDDLSGPVLARTLRNAMTTFQLESEIYHRAHYDSLTGLANRVTFTVRLREAVEQARRYQRRLCLLYIDVDHFKQVNDEYGHEWGDLLLTQVASRLRASIRHTDLAARLGGDEFVLLLFEADVNQGLSVAEKIFHAMAKPIQRGSINLTVSLSIGVADFPASASNERELVTHADVALYKAKARGRAQFATFSQEDVIAWRERKLLKKVLPTAIAENHLSVRFAPLFEASSGACALVAVSVHWDTPSFSLKNEEIFALATDQAVQQALCNWLITCSFRQLQLWRATHRALGLVLPLTTELFQQPGIRSVIEEILRSRDLLQASLYLPVGVASEAGAGQDWGVSPLLPVAAWIKTSQRPDRGQESVTLVERLSDPACGFCQMSNEVLTRASAKGFCEVLPAVAAMGQPLGVAVLSMQLPASQAAPPEAPSQRLPALAVRRLGLVQPQPGCEDWQEFLTKAIDLAIVLPDAAGPSHTIGPMDVTTPPCGATESQGAPGEPSRADALPKTQSSIEHQE